MDTTVVIVNWNGGEMLLRCLESIRLSECCHKVEVLVIDNDSGDGSREMAASRFPEYAVINSGANLGFGRANNLAASRVKTPLVLFLNPDTELSADTLQKMIDCLSSHPEVGLLGCMMRYPEGGVQELGLQWFPTPWTILMEVMLPTGWKRGWLRRWLPVVDPHRSGYVRKLYGGCLLARREVLDVVGWFDQRYFMYAEDVDLSRSVADRGWKLFYTADAEIMHESGGTSAKAPSGFSVLMKAQSINQLIQKHQGRCASVFYRGALLLGSGIRLLGLLPLRVIRSGPDRARWKEGGEKHKLIALWALGLKHPTIAQRVGAPAVTGTIETVDARG